MQSNSLKEDRIEDKYNDPRKQKKGEPFDIRRSAENKEGKFCYRSNEKRRKEKENMSDIKGARKRNPDEIDEKRKGYI